MFNKTGEDEVFLKDEKKKYDCIKIVNKSDIENYSTRQVVFMSWQFNRYIDIQKLEKM